jgi:DNA-binding CsgD family transcriptional regulator
MRRPVHDVPSAVLGNTFRMNKAHHDKLSRRQVECLLLVAEGMSSKEIGKNFGLSPSTVDSHISAAIDRLGASNRNHAARMVQNEQNDSDIKLPVEESGDVVRDRHFLAVPPLGGVENRLSIKERIMAITHIAMVAIFTFAAIVFSISGLVQLFVKS